MFKIGLENRDFCKSLHFYIVDAGTSQHLLACSAALGRCPHYLFFLCCGALASALIYVRVFLQISASLHDNAKLARVGVARAAPAHGLTELFLIKYFVLIFNFSVCSRWILFFRLNLNDICMYGMSRPTPTRR